LQRLMRFLGEDEHEPPDTLTEKLHRAFLRTLLEARSCWTIFTITDIFAQDMRFNRPGTAAESNWSQRLDRPLAAYEKDPAMSAMLNFLREEIGKTGRVPAAKEKS